MSSADQGFYLGVAFAIGAVARIVGPFVAVTGAGTTLFRICAALFAATVWLQLRSAGVTAGAHMPRVGHSAKRLSLFDKRLPPVSWSVTCIG